MTWPFDECWLRNNWPIIGVKYQTNWRKIHKIAAFFSQTSVLNGIRSVLF